MIKKLFSVTAIFCVIMFMGVLAIENKAAAEPASTPFHKFKFFYSLYDLDTDVMRCREGDVILSGGASCDFLEGFVLSRSAAWFLYDPVKEAWYIDRWEGICTHPDTPGYHYDPTYMHVTCGSMGHKLKFPPPGLFKNSN